MTIKYIVLFSLLLFFCSKKILAEESYHISEQGYFIGGFEHVTDWKLAEAITNFLQTEKAETVVDFGCGDGDYVNYFIKRGIKAIGYDGNPVTEITSDGTCFVLDLSNPINLNMQFDWVMSLEVGEHLPKQYETVFIENLLRHTKKGLILSWAIKGQGGIGHFNEQNNDYIKKIMKKYRWISDMEAENQLREQVAVPWFKNTLMVFRPLSESWTRKRNP